MLRIQLTIEPSPFIETVKVYIKSKEEEEEGEGECQILFGNFWPQLLTYSSGAGILSFELPRLREEEKRRNL